MGLSLSKGVFLGVRFIFLCECDGFFSLSLCFGASKGDGITFGVSRIRRQGDEWMDCFNWISSTCSVGWF